jgi:hypothetical protein
LTSNEDPTSLVRRGNLESPTHRYDALSAMHALTCAPAPADGTAGAKGDEPPARQRATMPHELPSRAEVRR